MNMKKLIWFTFLAATLTSVPALSDSAIHEEAERTFKPNYLELAEGDFSKRKTVERHPWPVSVLSIGHTMASYQNYSFVSQAYFHHGLDIRAEAGSDVVASAGGKVINIENYMPGDDAYWEVAILDEAGFIWQYHHIEKSSIPPAIYDAYESQSSIPAGTKLGEVYFWKVVTFGERFHHIHLNILGRDKEYLNPFSFLERLPDSRPPEIAEFSYLKSKGTYSIGVHLKDWILSDVFIVPPYHIEVAIDGQKPFTVWKFDRLPGGSDNEKFVNRFFLPRLACGNYQCRKPVIDLGFNQEGKQVFPLSKGKHHLELRVSDYAGNTASRNYDWDVKD